MAEKYKYRNALGESSAPAGGSGATTTDTKTYLAANRPAINAKVEGQEKKFRKKPAPPARQPVRRRMRSAADVSAKDVGSGANEEFKALAKSMLDPATLNANVGKNFSKDERAARVGSRTIQNQRLVAKMMAGQAGIETNQAGASARATAGNKLSRANMQDNIANQQDMQQDRLAANQATQERGFTNAASQTQTANTRDDRIRQETADRARRDQALKYRMSGGTAEGAGEIASASKDWAPNYDRINPTPGDTPAQKPYEFIGGKSMPDPNEPGRTIMGQDRVFNPNAGSVSTARAMTDDELNKRIQGLR